MILSLFDFSGAWSDPYREAGYPVLQCDLKLGINVLELLPAHFDRIAVHGILAAPPCTDFSVSGARWWKQKDADGRTEASLRLLDRTLDLINELNPAWWVIENPIGRIPTLRPSLGKPAMYFDPWEFGDPYTKRTCLWGQFNTNLKRTPVEPVRVCKQGSWVQRLGGSSDRTKTLRSVTPAGFARAFFEANP